MNGGTAGEGRKSHEINLTFDLQTHWNRIELKKGGVPESSRGERLMGLKSDLISSSAISKTSSRKQAEESMEKKERKNTFGKRSLEV